MVIINTTEMKHGRMEHTPHSREELAGWSTLPHSREEFLLGLES